MRRPPALAFLSLSGCAFALLALPGCTFGTNRLRWKVEHADRVALQVVDPTREAIPAYDLDHAKDVLPAGAAPSTVSVPFRSGSVPFRRNADGSIDALFAAGTWHVAAADGAVTPLREDAAALPPSGTAWAFLGAPPPGVGWRTPWQLRLATPRDNVVDARVLVRRDRTAGGILLAYATLVATPGTVGVYFGSRADSPNRGLSLTLGTIGLAGAVTVVAFGLHALLLREHDEVLGGAAGERR